MNTTKGNSKRDLVALLNSIQTELENTKQELLILRIKVITSFAVTSIIALLYLIS